MIWRVLHLDLRQMKHGWYVSFRTLLETQAAIPLVEGSLSTFVSYVPSILVDAFSNRYSWLIQKTILSLGGRISRHFSMLPVQSHVHGADYRARTYRSRSRGNWVEFQSANRRDCICWRPGRSGEWSHAFLLNGVSIARESVHPRIRYCRCCGRDNGSVHDTFRRSVVPRGATNVLNTRSIDTRVRECVRCSHWVLRRRGLRQLSERDCNANELRWPGDLACCETHRKVVLIAGISGDRPFYRSQHVQSNFSMDPTPVMRTFCPPIINFWSRSRRYETVEPSRT